MSASPPRSSSGIRGPSRSPDVVAGLVRERRPGHQCRAHRQHRGARAARQGHRGPRDPHRHPAQCRRGRGAHRPRLRPATGPNPFPPTRPMLVGTMVRGDTTFRIHLHVQPEPDELRRDVAFRDALRADPELTRMYAALKTQIVGGGVTEGHQYTYRSRHGSRTCNIDLAWIVPPIAPPATIGLLGGGQLGRMLALAARAMGYRVAVLDPDPDCPTAALADRSSSPATTTSGQRSVSPSSAMSSRTSWSTSRAGWSSRSMRSCPSGRVDCH